MMDTQKIPNTNIEASLKWIAARAWHDRTHPDVDRLVRELVRSDAEIRTKVVCIVGWVWSRCRDFIPSVVDPTTEMVIGLPELLAGRAVAMDADDAVLAAATVCSAAGVPVRIVGARYGYAWTCWLAYQDETGQWGTVDAQTGESVGERRRKPDEQIEIDCPPDGPRGSISDRLGER
jgi:hypothetical protein